MLVDRAVDTVGTLDALATSGSELCARRVIMPGAAMMQGSQDGRGDAEVAAKGAAQPIKRTEACGYGDLLQAPVALEHGPGELAPHAFHERSRSHAHL